MIKLTVFELSASNLQQVCIPIGCVPPAHWPCSLLGGGVDVLIWSWGGGWICYSGPGGCPGGGGLWGCWPGLTEGGADHVTYLMMHLMSPPPPEVGQTDASENITFARFPTRAVIRDTVTVFLHCTDVSFRQCSQKCYQERNISLRLRCIWTHLQPIEINFSYSSELFGFFVLNLILSDLAILCRFGL